MILVTGVVVVMGGIFAWYRFVVSDRARHHEYAIDWPVASPRGEPVVIAYGLKPGDIFHTRRETHFRIVLSVEKRVDVRGGMNLDAKILVGHRIDAAPAGGPPGLRSTYRVAVEDADSNPADWKSPIWTLLNSATAPYILTQDRDASGAPTGPASGAPYVALERKVLDSVLCGLGDVTTQYLPRRPIRLGDVWDLAEAVDLPGILAVVRYVARTDEYPTGYPPATVTAKVAAEALESREGEPCLRLRLVVYVTQEGDVVAPALEGRLTTAAKIDGHIWVSTDKGIVWEESLDSEITTSYLCARPSERFATASMRGKTFRAEFMPGR